MAIKFNKNEIKSIWLLFFTIILGVGFFNGLIKDREVERQRVEAIIEKQRQFESLNPFNELTVLANSVYVYDFKNQKVIYQKNSSTPQPIASIVKLITAIVALEQSDPDSILTVSKKAISQTGSSSIRLGEKWKLGDLTKVMLIESSNDAAYAIAEHVGEKLEGEENSILKFVSAMNKKASEINMTNSTFYNPSGLDESEDNAGAYSSAEDVSKMITYLSDNFPEYSESTEVESLEIISESKIAHKIINTNKSISSLPGLKSSKTGYTQKAGGNLAIITEPQNGERLSIVILGSTLNGRFNDIVTIFEKASSYKKLALEYNINLSTLEL